MNEHSKSETDERTQKLREFGTNLAITHILWLSSAKDRTTLGVHLTLQDQMQQSLTTLNSLDQADKAIAVEAYSARLQERDEYEQKQAA
jgi:hypothetical protein